MTTNLLEEVRKLISTSDSNSDSKDARTHSTDACEGDSTDHDSSDQQADLLLDAKPNSLSQGATIDKLFGSHLDVGIINTLYKTAV